MCERCAGNIPCLAAMQAQVLFQSRLLWKDKDLSCMCLAHQVVGSVIIIIIFIIVIVVIVIIIIIIIIIIVYYTLSGCCASTREACTFSAMPCQGFRWGMRSLKETSSMRFCTSLTSLLKAGIERRSAASTDLAATAMRSEL